MIEVIMTVIAWDGNTLASDSRITASARLITDKYNKLEKLNNIKYKDDELLYLGMSGTVIDKDYYIAILEQDKFTIDRKTGEHELAGIIVGKKYVYKFEQGSCWLIKYNKKTKLAAGSGSPYAISGMTLGLDAVQACRHATLLDTSCGGRINSVKGL